MKKSNKNVKPMSMTLLVTPDIFREYKQKTTSIEYVLSEFIDNSIASAENNNLKFYGLKIVVDVNQIDNDKQEITITDNANGMDQKELMNSMQPNVYKSNNNKNQYGVGMKLGIFWLGAGVYIWSKRKNDYEYKLNLHLDHLDQHVGKKEQEGIQSVAVLSNDDVIKTSSGTKIKIVDVYKEHMIKRNEEIINSIRETLGSRYRDYLGKNSEGKQCCEIVFNFYKNGMPYGEPYHVEKMEIKPYCIQSTINKLCSDKKNKIDPRKYIENAKRNLESDEFKKTQHLLEKICNGRNIAKDFLSGKQLLYEYSIKINGKKTNFKWGILEYSHNFSRYNGIRLIHSKRGIRHAPNIRTKSDAKIEAYPFASNILGGKGNSAIIRLFGEIDLTGISTPEENKQGFAWNNNSIEKRDIDEFCQEIWNGCKIFINILLSCENAAKIGTNALTSKKSLTRIKKENEEHFSQLSILDPINPGDPPIYKFHDFIFKFVHIPSDRNDNAFDIEFVAKKEILIKINTNHKMWYGFLEDPQTETKFKARLLYPLSLCFALCKSIYDSKTKNDEDISTFAKQLCDKAKNDFGSIINAIIKKLSKE